MALSRSIPANSKARGENIEPESTVEKLSLVSPACALPPLDPGLHSLGRLGRLACAAGRGPVPAAQGAGPPAGQILGPWASLSLQEMLAKGQVVSSLVTWHPRPPVSERRAMLALQSPQAAWGSREVDG